jgi:hypothetical protein
VNPFLLAIVEDGSLDLPAALQGCKNQKQ